MDISFEEALSKLEDNDFSYISSTANIHCEGDGNLREKVRAQEAYDECSYGRRVLASYFAEAEEKGTIDDLVKNFDRILSISSRKLADPEYFFLSCITAIAKHDKTGFIVARFDKVVNVVSDLPTSKERLIGILKDVAKNDNSEGAADKLAELAQDPKFLSSTAYQKEGLTIPDLLKVIVEEMEIEDNSKLAGLVAKFEGTGLEQTIISLATDRYETLLREAAGAGNSWTRRVDSEEDTSRLR